MDLYLLLFYFVALKNPWQNEHLSILVREYSRSLGTVEPPANTIALIFSKQIINTDIHSYIGIAFKNDTFFFHQFNPSVNHPFFQFKIRNTITQQTARHIISFKNSYSMSCIIQLCSSSQSRRARTNTATFFPERRLGFLAFTNPFSKAISIICFSISSIATAG